MSAVVEYLIAELRINAAHREKDNRRADQVELFVRAMLQEYSERLSLTERAILLALERRRDYWCVNYYQEANFPKLEGVTIWPSLKEMQDAVAKYEFRCPSCDGVSTDPYVCNSGLPGGLRKGEGKICDWKVFGLFGCLGKGYRFTIREGFLDKPIIDNIFMPLTFEDNESPELLS